MSISNNNNEMYYTQNQQLSKNMSSMSNTSNGRLSFIHLQPPSK